MLSIKNSAPGMGCPFLSCWLIRSSKGPSKSSIIYCHWLPSRTIQWDPTAGYTTYLSHTPWGIKLVPAWKLCPNRLAFMLKGPVYTARGEKSPLILLNVGVVKTLATVSGFWMPSCQKPILSQEHNKLGTLLADLACVVSCGFIAAMVLNTQQTH